MKDSDPWKYARENNLIIVTKKVTLPEFNDKAMYDELNRRNIFDSYAELEFAE